MIDKVAVIEHFKQGRTIVLFTVNNTVALNVRYHSIAMLNDYLNKCVKGRIVRES